MTTRTFNWGIIGPGRIARKFADDLRLLPNAKLHAVASTSAERAQSFANAYGAPYAYDRYTDIVNCHDLDVVYIATPHTLHTEHALLCLEQGIPVLCEKPFSMNAAAAKRMINTARRQRTFLMEALWTRFIPAFDHALTLAAQGEIGHVHTVTANFGFKMPFDATSRLFNKALGGGALLDIGIYPVLLALSVFGKPEPENVQAAATFTTTDVDESCAYSFRYGTQQLALGHATLAAHIPVDAAIYGTEGSIYLHPRWHHPSKLTIAKYEGRDEIKRDIEMPYEGWGYHFEAAHVMECLENGLLESDRVPLDFTLDLMETLDLIREKVGLEY